MKNVVLYLLFASVLIFQGCKYQDAKKFIPKYNFNLSLKNISIPDSLIKNFRYVKLETNSNCLIGEVSKVIFKDRIYILDKKVTKSVFVFDLTGRFLFKISKFGKGPGEYLFINDFDIDNLGNVYILDLRTKMILKYSSKGEFLNHLDYNFWTYSFSYLGYDHYIFNQNYRTDNNMNLICWKNGRIIWKKFPYSSQKQEKKRHESVEYRLLHSNGNTLYTPRDSYTIYDISIDSVLPKYQLNFGTENEIDTEELYSIAKSEQTKYLLNSNYVWGLNHYFETNDFFCISFYYQQRYMTAFISKRDGKNLILDCLSCIAGKNNVLGNLMTIGVVGDEFISMIDLQQISHLRQSKNSSLYYNNSAFIESITPDSNPIFVLYTIKEL